MNWGQIGTEIIIGIIGLVFSGLGVFITYLINKFIKDQKLKDIINSLHEVVRNSVLEVYQVYVEGLKEKDLFDRNAQKLALERCFELIKTNMSSDVEEWLKSNVKDVQGYLKGLIEAQIGALKNSGR